MSFMDSKILEGTASITFEELKEPWPDWNDSERRAFCGCGLIYLQTPDVPDMLRFVMEHCDMDDWSAISLPIAANLPLKESVPFLTKACHEAPFGHAANFYQALARTQAPESRKMLRAHLEELWKHPKFPKGGFNGLAHEAACCVTHLLELGDKSLDLEEKYRTLLSHPAEIVREHTRNMTSKYFSADGATSTTS